IPGRIVSRIDGNDVQRLGALNHEEPIDHRRSGHTSDLMERLAAVELSSVRLDLDRREARDASVAAVACHRRFVLDGQRLFIRIVDIHDRFVDAVRDHPFTLAEPTRYLGCVLESHVARPPRNSEYNSMAEHLRSCNW